MFEQPSAKKQKRTLTAVLYSRIAVLSHPYKEKIVDSLTRKAPGVLACLCIAVPCWFLGTAFPLIGGPVFAILAGMVIALVWKRRDHFQDGIAYTSKKVLQYAVIVLGFGLNLAEVARVGLTSLPIICSTIATALIVAAALCRVMRMPSKIATLIGVGSSICSGSAIAATAPVIKADDEEVAQAISVIFLFNVAAALIFPTLGTMLSLTNEGFGLFAGTAVNDTSSVTAAAAAWDGMHPGANALDYATVVKLTRTLAIIPITLVLSLWVMHREKKEAEAGVEEAAEAGATAATVPAEAASSTAAAGTAGAPTTSGFSLKRAFPMFILFFLIASLITTIAVAAGVDESTFAPLKTLSKFLIVMAMAAIGLNTDLVKLVKSGGKPLLMGFICWVCIAAVSLGMQHALGLW